MPKRAENWRGRLRITRDGGSVWLRNFARISGRRFARGGTDVNRNTTSLPRSDAPAQGASESSGVTWRRAVEK